MDKPNAGTFESQVLPHLDAAFGLARWLVRSDTDAEDRVQDAYLRAWKSFAGFRGGDAKAWLLAIVRNACYTWLKSRRLENLSTPFDEEIHGPWDASDNPHARLALDRDRQAIRRAVEALPVEFREVLVLREWQGCSYREISEIADIPIGTVMSRLLRARERLHKSLARSGGEG
ncbi:MAG: sigma-70 family RNA polymerase sigma factor [Fibrobacteres bacterium]|nr:sigma-70 family RNA polymerase sigma factor [Fibrobacterota bacterium]